MKDEEEDEMYKPLLDDTDMETSMVETTLRLKRGQDTSYEVCNRNIPP